MTNPDLEMKGMRFSAFAMKNDATAAAATSSQALNVSTGSLGHGHFFLTCELNIDLSELIGNNVVTYRNAYKQ